MTTSSVLAQPPTRSSYSREDLPDPTQVPHVDLIAIDEATKDGFLHGLACYALWIFFIAALARCRRKGDAFIAASAGLFTLVVTSVLVAGGWVVAPVPTTMRLVAGCGMLLLSFEVACGRTIVPTWVTCVAWSTVFAGAMLAPLGHVVGPISTEWYEEEASPFLVGLGFAVLTILAVALLARPVLHRWITRPSYRRIVGAGTAAVAVVFTVGDVHDWKGMRTSTLESIFLNLHTQLYQAYNMNDSAAASKALQECLAGDYFDQTHRDFMETLANPEAGRAYSKYLIPGTVKVLDHDEVGFDVEYVWILHGKSVPHYHLGESSPPIRLRTDQYRQRFRVERCPTGWRIVKAGDLKSQQTNGIPNIDIPTWMFWRPDRVVRFPEPTIVPHTHPA